jgi:hypothetical protein
MTTASRASRTTKKDVVLFLGAGFAKAAGLPVMADFGPESTRERRTLIKRHSSLSPKNRQHRFAAARVIDASTTFEAFRDLCVQSGTRTRKDWQNLETVFCAAEALAEAGVPEILLRVPAHRLRGGFLEQPFSTSSILKDIQLWIWKVYQKMPLVQKKPPVPVDPEAYQRFFSSLQTFGITERLTVVTTNYDLVFEYTSSKCGMPMCSYPMAWGEEFNVSRAPRPYIVAGPTPDTITVCKLHGSVNYFEDAETSTTQRVRIAADIGGGPTIGNSGGSAGRPALFALDAIWAVEKRYGPGLTPAIVPPTYAKLGRQRWLREVWSAARTALSSAHHIIFVGYSLPASDGFMSALLAGAAALRNDGGAPDITVIDPSARSYANIAEVYGRSRTRWIKATLSDATVKEFDDLLRTL